MVFLSGGGQKNVWAQVAFYTSLGFIIPGGAVGGYFFGWLLDEHLHTTPIFGIIGGLAGTAGGIVEVLQLVIRTEKRRADGNDSSSGSGRR